MHSRIQDGLFGLFLGHYINPTVSLFGFEIQWILILLIVFLSITTLKKLITALKKLRRFLWQKLVEELRKELFNQ